MTKVWMLASFARVVLLASGSGSLAQAIIDAEELDIEIVALISDNPDAHALTRAAISAFQDEANTGPEMHPGIVQLLMSV